MTERFIGKYQAIVVDNDDPRGLARIKVRAPEVFGDETTGWALPCSPYAGPNAGLAAVPPVGSLVYVEWPAGDTSRVPIWSGGSWADGEGVPDAGPDVLVLVTPAGHKVELRDSAGSESIEVMAVSGARMLLDSNGISIEFGSQKIALTSASVSVNDGALEVV
ncbi:MAG: phage baseplate assembly protein V [Gaiellaceae bacterium]